MTYINIQIKKSFIALSLNILSAFSWSCCEDKSEGNYSMSNQAFIAQVSSANSFGLSAGTLATSKGQKNEIKQYGAQMTNDYTIAKLAFSDLSLQKKWNAPTEMMAYDQDNLFILNQLNGKNFDREYLRLMVASYQQMITLCTAASAANGLSDVDLRVMAAARLRIFKGYLE